MARSRISSGFTLVEVVIVAALLGALMIMVTSLAASGADAQEYARRLNRVTEINQDLVDGVRMELVSSVTLYGRDTAGLAHRDAVDLTGWPAPINTWLPPRIAPSEEPRADSYQAATPKTGNMLFFARLAWVDSYRAPTSGRSFMTDVFQWVMYYLTPEDGGPAPGTPAGLNLVRWVSEPLADATRIQAISNVTDRREVCEHLLAGSVDLDGEVHEPVTLLWVRGANPAAALGCFYEIDPDASFDLSATPLAPRTSPFKVKGFRTIQPAGMLAYRHHSVSSIYAPPSASATLYGIPSPTQDGFPHGFEVQIVGPSAARQVVVRSALTSTNNRGLKAISVVQTVVDCRDI